MSFPPFQSLSLFSTSCPRKRVISYTLSSSFFLFPLVIPSTLWSPHLPLCLQSWIMPLMKPCMHVCVHAKSLQSCLTHRDPVDCSPAGSSVHGILQVRILEWVAISSSRGSSGPRDQTHICCGSCIAGRFFTTEPLGNLPPLLVNISKILSTKQLKLIFLSELAYVSPASLCSLFPRHSGRSLKPLIYLFSIPFPLSLPNLSTLYLLSTSLQWWSWCPFLHAFLDSGITIVCTLHVGLTKYGSGYASLPVQQPSVMALH